MSVTGVRREAVRCVDIYKAEYAENMCRVGEVLLSFSSGILTLVTFGTGFWLQAKKSISGESVPTFHYGLWQNCSISGGTTSCTTIPLNGPGM